MKIVDVCAFYSPKGGGVRTYVDQKLLIGPRLGCEIVIIAPGDEDSVVERGPGARVVTLRSPRFPLDRKYWYFAEPEALHAALDAERPDFVEGTSPWRSAGLVANWRGDAPRSLVMHADPLSAYAYRWFGQVFSRPTIDRQFSMFWNHLRRHCPRFEHVVCANADFARRLREGGVSGTVTVPMGVEIDRFSPALRDEALRARLLADCGLPPKASLLIGVGRLAAEKQWPFVIDAVSAASQHRPIGLAIFGEGRDHRTIRNHIGGNPHIRLFAPERDRAAFARILASADALAHGSEAETFCMVAAEARASGIPVIVPDRGAALDHAANGFGISYASGDRASAAACILSVLAGWRRPEARVRTIEDHFADLFALYRRTLAGEREAA